LTTHSPNSTFLVDEKGCLFFLYFPRSPDGAVECGPDDKTGGSSADGDDETLFVHLDKVNPRIQEIIFCLDVSESMIGEHLDRMEEGLGRIVKELRTDPYALETVHLSVIAFAGQVKLLALLIELPSFYPPQLPVGGGTSLGKALNFLMDEIDRTVVRTTAETKGDWKPIIFLITDGKPTDNTAAAVARWKGRYQPHANLIAVSIGRNADLSLLRELTENVLILEESQEGDFRKLIGLVHRHHSVPEPERRPVRAGDDGPGEVR
jgi:uncharacterized protein YegL